jgi:hypothetical protein
VKKRSKYAGQFFPAVYLKIATEKDVVEASEKIAKRDGDLTIAELSKALMPNPNATAGKAVIDMLDLVNSLMPKTLDGILDESNIARGGLLEARGKLQMLQAFTEANNEDVNAAIVLAMRVCRLVAHEVYRPTEEFIGKGISQELGRNKSKQARGVTQEEWIERKQKATSSMKEHNNNKIKVAKSLGIKPSTLENWLRGGRREKK